MRFKSHRQPLCRACGKPLRKYGTGVTLTLERTQYQNDASYHRYIVVDQLPQTKAECQRLTNKKVINVKRYKPFEYDTAGKSEPVDKGIDQFTEWDGETYTDEFFCTNTCAIAFGEMAARSGKVQSVAYVDSIREQEGKKPLYELHRPLKSD